MKNAILSAVALGVAGYTSAVSAAITTGTVDNSIQGTTNTADVAIQNIIANFFTFLYLIAVLYAIWGGFNILTAGGDEEKVKKGKTILIQAILGLIVIFLASAIINWVLTSIVGTF